MAQQSLNFVLISKKIKQELMIRRASGEMVGPKLWTWPLQLSLVPFALHQGLAALLTLLNHMLLARIIFTTDLAVPLTRSS